MFGAFCNTMPVPAGVFVPVFLVGKFIYENKFIHFQQIIDLIKLIFLHAKIQIHLSIKQNT